MTNKQVQYTYLGANQDTTKSKHPVQFYYEAGHIKLNATSDQSTGSVSNEKGNEMVFQIPDIHLQIGSKKLKYGNKSLTYSNSELLISLFGFSIPNDMTISNNIIIGHTTSRDGIILFTTNDEGIDAIWYLKEVIDSKFDLELLYVRKLGFSKDHPIQAIFNYENVNIQKVYWIDGINQVRFININYNQANHDGNLIDVPLTTLDFVGQVKFSQPTIDSITSGGSHKAGVIQYAYNLFRINGAQTKISPLSKMVALDKGPGLGGGRLDETVGSSPIVRFSNLDSRYTHIKIYAIKYTSYNEVPSINLIDERELSGEDIVLLDDGSVIDSLSLEEFLFLGSDPIVPQHIETKDNRLFPANIKYKNFILPEELDCRIYSFPINSTEVKVLDEVTGFTTRAEGTGLTPINDTYHLNKKHSAINRNFNVNKYRYNSTQLGGDGKFLYYELSSVTDKDLDNDAEDIKFFKDDEIYRIGIQFYNNLGQKSLPQWMFDFKSLSGNLEGNYTSIKVGIKQSLIDLVTDYNTNNDDNIVGFKVIRAERNFRDKTILYQGIISTMIYQTKDAQYIKEQHEGVADPRRDVDRAQKVPTFLARHYVDEPDVSHVPDVRLPLSSGIIKLDGGWLSRNEHLRLIPSEILVAKKQDSKRQYPFLYDKMMQLYSPETIFDGYSDMTRGLEVSVKGMVNSTDQNAWIRETFINSKREKYGGKILHALNMYHLGDEGEIIEDNVLSKASEVPPDDVIGGRFGFIRPSGAQDTMNEMLYYREYNKFTPAMAPTSEKIWGKPEFAERGKEQVSYNGHNDYRYVNNLKSIITDDPDHDGTIGLSSVNDYAARSITFVLNDDVNIPSELRTGSVQLYNKSKVVDHPECEGDGLLTVEIKKPESLIYLSNIYGGNSYEEKARTVYLEIGEYKSITQNAEVNIVDGGDTFVQKFKFLRIGKPDEELYAANTMQLSEIIEFPVETTIDVKNRSDNSIGAWDSVFQPLYDEYHNYNYVYSQSPILIVNQNTDYKFNRVDMFDTRIQATKLKIPNESVDSWTDILRNVTLDLDGKYGSINNLISFKDEIYAFQDSAIGHIQINPRVQIQSNDNIGVELGKGGILYDYKYLTTKSGSINKWGAVSGIKGIYYYDALNKAVGRVPDFMDVPLSDMKGLHTFYNSEHVYDHLKQDNPIIKRGALFGIDIHNNDVYFTLLQYRNNLTIQKIKSLTATNKPPINNNHTIMPTTWCFNELRDEFIDLKPGYNDVTRYVQLGNKLFVSRDNKKLYEQYLGEYNKFFDKLSPSYITLQVNPESNVDCVFDNIHYNSEVYLNDIDQPDKTLTHIQAYNEYQDSGKIPLIVGRGSNIRRKFREWRADIPRDGRNRIRNPWIFLKLEFDNESNYKMILHDVIIKYSR